MEPEEVGDGTRRGEVLVSWALVQALQLVSGVQRQVPSFRHNILGTVQTKGSI